jgi:hypothetical protein
MGFAMGRRPIGDRAMTDTERQRRRRERLRHPQPVQEVTEAELRWLEGMNGGDPVVWNRILRGSQRVRNAIKRQEEALRALRRLEEARERELLLLRWPRSIGPRLTKEDLEGLRPKRKKLAK